MMRAALARLASARWGVVVARPGRTAATVASASPAQAVRLLTIDRTDMLNALGEDVLRDMAGLLKEAQDDEGVRAIVIAGAGDKAFAAGADIKEMVNLSAPDVHQREYLWEWQRAFGALRKPTVAAVRGVALGGGCELAMLCDTIVAGTSARFGTPELKLGTICGMGGTQRLVRSVGKAKAMDLLLTGRHMHADEAERCGLVARVVDDDRVVDEAVAMAADMANRSAPAVAAMREAALAALETPLQVGLRHEAALFWATFANRDRAEGMQAFVEKRAPVWEHR